MIPRTLSASSLQVWTFCQDRWASEYLDRAPSFSNSAADVGTTFHGAAEMFVKAFFIDKTHDLAMGRVKQKELLITFYQMSYIQTFGTADFETPEYKDGFDLTMRWFKRTDLETKPMKGVVSAEVKRTIKVPYNHPDGTVHELDFNYIMDRVDQIEETVYEVVDYKTIRVPLQPEDLENKIQARAYALAVQIEHPDATKVVVTFDLIRHEPISLTFTREDNIAFWRFLTEETQKIIDTDRDKIRPKLNPECGYCVKKFTCPVMQSNLTAGGIMSLDVDTSIQLIADLKNQIKANNLIVEALEDNVMRHAAETDVLGWETGDGAYEVEIGVGRRRAFPADQAAKIMGPELFAQMGNMTLGNLEKIIKDESIDKSTRDELSNLISWTNGNLQLKIKPKKKLV